MTRLDKLKGFIKNKDEALLITNEVNIGYFSGFFHSEGYLLVTGENSYLIVDFRYAEAAEKKSSGCKVVMYSKLSQDLLDILTKEGISSVSFEADSITVSRFDFFKKFLARQNIDCFADQKLCKHIADIRIIKDSSEIEKIQKAQNIAEKAYLEVLNFVKPGVTEKEISARLDYLMNIYGAECKSFDLITITGKKTSLPQDRKSVV